MSIAAEKMRIGNLIREMKEGAGLTQEALAMEMDVSRTTVTTWESGGGQMIQEILRWKRLCQATHQDPVRATVQLMHPEVYAGSDRPDDIPREQKREALIYYLDTVDSELIVDQLYFIFCEDHGSVPEAVVQEMTANLHTPLHMRTSVALQISNNYKASVRLGQDPCPDSIHPDVQMLDHAADQASRATMEGRAGYSVRTGE